MSLTDDAASVTVTTPSDTEIVISRVFAAPRDRVFDALTTPELLVRWHGAQGWQLAVCEVDLRVGGRWRELFTMDLGPEVAPTMEVDGRFRSRMLARDDLRLELLCWSEPDAHGDGRRRPMTQLGMTHLCFRVDDVDALGAMADAAVAAGGGVHPATRSAQEGMGVDGAPVKTMYLTDPDGVRIEVMSGAPDLGTL